MLIGSTTNRKGCGRSKNLVFQKSLSVNSGQQIKIVIPPGLEELVGKWDKIFKVEVGIIVKMNLLVVASSSDDVPQHVVSEMVYTDSGKVCYIQVYILYSSLSFDVRTKLFY